MTFRLRSEACIHGVLIGVCCACDRNRKHAIERAIAQRRARAYTRTMFDLWEGEGNSMAKETVANAQSEPETATANDADKDGKSKRKHKATYATDKRKGGYLIRVQGPTAERFAGREVPVTTRMGAEHIERLERLIWTGKDEESGEPCALYKFESKPREETELPF